MSGFDLKEKAWTWPLGHLLVPPCLGHRPVKGGRAREGHVGQSLGLGPRSQGWLFLSRGLAGSGRCCDRGAGPGGHRASCGFDVWMGRAGLQGHGGCWGRQEPMWSAVLVARAQSGLSAVSRVLGHSVSCPKRSGCPEPPAPGTPCPAVPAERLGGASGPLLAGLGVGPGAGGWVGAPSGERRSLPVRGPGSQESPLWPSPSLSSPAPSPCPSPGGLQRRGRLGRAGGRPPAADGPSRVRRPRFA